MMSELEGEVDWPLPKRAVMIMKYFLGLRALSSPMSHSLSAIAMMVSYRWRKPIDQLTARIPAWVYYSRRFGISKCLVCYVSIWKTLTGLELPVAELVGLDSVAGLCRGYIKLLETFLNQMARDIHFERMIRGFFSIPFFFLSQLVLYIVYGWSADACTPHYHESVSGDPHPYDNSQLWRTTLY
jgi:hypothetical protein